MTPAASVGCPRRYGAGRLLALAERARSRRRRRRPWHSQPALPAELTMGRSPRCGARCRRSWCLALWIVVPGHDHRERWSRTIFAAQTRALSPSELSLVLNDVRNVVAGDVSPWTPYAPEVRAAADEYIELRRVSRLALTALILAIGIIGALLVRVAHRTGSCARATPWSASSSGCSSAVR